MSYITPDSLLKLPEYQNKSPAEKAEFAGRFYDKWFAPQIADGVERNKKRSAFITKMGASVPEAQGVSRAFGIDTSKVRPQLPDLAKAVNIVPPEFYKEQVPPEPTGYGPGGILYGGARIASVLERQAMALGELTTGVLAGAVKHPPGLGGYQPPPTDYVSPTAKHLRSWEKYYGQPEKTGFLTPKVTRDQAAYRQRAYAAGTVSGITKDILEGGLDVGTLVLGMGALGVLGRGAPPALQKAPAILKQIGARVARLGVHGYLTTKGSMEDRIQAAATRIGYNITPYIVQSWGVAGPVAAPAVDTMLNTFLSMPTYIEAYKEAGGLNEDFLSMAIPQWAMDVGFALSTRGLPAKEFNRKMKVYYNKRLAGMGLSRSETTKLIKKTQGIADKYGFEKEFVAPTKKPREKVSKKAHVIQNERIRRIVSATNTPANFFRKKLGEARELKHEFGKLMLFKPDLRTHPVYRNDVRKFIDTPIDAKNKAEKAIHKIIGEPLLGRKEFKIFEKLVPLKDLEVTAKKGLPVPQKATVAEIASGLSDLQKASSPRIDSAVDKHFKKMRLMRDELVARGKMMGGEDFYYPHMVLDYEPIWADRVGLSKRLKTTYRPYTKKRRGSVKDIEMDYVKVMETHIAKVELDNAMDDFLAYQMNKNDVLPAMSKQDREKALGKKGTLVAGKIYTVGGKRHKAVQATPGNALYPASTINESLFNQAIENNMTAEEFSAMVGARGGKPIGKALALGKPHRIYLLPEAIANDILQFKTPRGDIYWLNKAVAATSVWKRMTLDFAGLPFQANNFFGDAINMIRDDPAAAVNVPRALKMIATPEKYWSPEDKELMTLARQQRVDVTYFLREAGILPEYGALNKFKHPMVRYNPLNWGLHMYEKVSVDRERTLRLAKFITDVNRIHQGKMVKASAIDVKGLDPIDAAGKVAREFTVDYSAISPQYRRGLRGLVFPFITFYDHNARNWGQYVTKRPANALIKFGIPAAAMWTWNNTGERREIEENLPDWWLFVPHVITGYKTKEGKPIIIALQTPIDMAARVVGLDRLPAKITKIRAGDMTIREAAIEQLKDLGLGPTRTLGALLNPMIQMMWGFASKKHPFFGTPIVPERFKGTDQENKYRAEFALSCVLAPYGQYLQASRMLEPGDVFSKWLLEGPFDYEAALGIREVDVQRGKEARLYETEEELTNEVKQVLADLERGFIKWQTTGEIKYWETARDSVYQKAETKPTREQVANRVYSWRTIEQIIREKLRKAKKDDPQIEEYRKTLDYIHKNRWLLHQRKVPRAIRTKIAVEALRIMSPEEILGTQ